MGAWRTSARAAVSAAVLACATGSGASTVTEPIARLSLEGGYDSNALYEGRGGDSVGRVSPDVGLRARDHLWTAAATYGADWIRYERFAPGGVWNHRLRLDVDARPSRRSTVSVEGRGGYAYDPVGLSLLGIFRTGRQSAWTALGRGRATYRIAERVDGAVTAEERLVRFDDRTGGAVHSAGGTVTWRWTPRLSVGGTYRISAFQTFLANGQEVALANALEGRAEYALARHVRLEAEAGPALWTGPGAHALVPEATATLLVMERHDALRVALHRGLGIGSTAAPGIVTSFEIGGLHRIGREWELRGAGGLWHSGRVPSGADPVLGYAVSAEMARRFGRDLRIGVAASHFDRLDVRSAALARTTVGLRVAWELDAR